MVQSRLEYTGDDTSCSRPSTELFSNLITERGPAKWMRELDSAVHKKTAGELCSQTRETVDA